MIREQVVIETKVVNPNDACPCCERIWMTLTPQGGPILTLLAEGFTPSSSTHIWQRHNGISWANVKIGGSTLNPSELGLLVVINDGDLIRVQFTDAEDCIHYSQASNIYLI